jgi:hypothetical protein
MRTLHLAAATALCVAGLAGAAPPPPSYAVTYLGKGAAVDVSDSGIVAGNGPTRDATALPWVWNKGVRTPLPLPPGMSRAAARAVNSGGIVVGHATDAASGTTRAVRWSPRNGRYDAELLPAPPGGQALVATDINDAGVIVGIAQIPGRHADVLGRRFVAQPKRAFRLRPGEAPEILEALGELPYTFLDFVRAPQINEAGTAYDGIRTLVLADGRVLRIPPVAIGSGTYEFNGFLNDAGNVGGQVGLTSSSMGSTVVGVRYSRGAGWSRYPRFAMPHGAFTALNARGDAAYYNGMYAPAPSIDYAGVGHYAPQALLQPADRHWTIRGGALLNDKGMVLTGGRSSRTGEAGIVLLAPVAAKAP